VKSFAFKKCRYFLGRLERGDDILAGLIDFCNQEDIEAGNISAIGAVESGGVGYFDQVASEYRQVRFDQGMEIASLTGNISLKDSKLFLHCHVVLADQQGRCFGGHLLEGNIAFACEFSIQALTGEPPLRLPDEATGLFLW